MIDESKWIVSGVKKKKSILIGYLGDVSAVLVGFRDTEKLRHLDHLGDALHVRQLATDLVRHAARRGHGRQLAGLSSEGAAARLRPRYLVLSRHWRWRRGWGRGREVEQSLPQHSVLLPPSQSVA